MSSSSVLPEIELSALPTAALGGWSLSAQLLACAGAPHLGAATIPIDEVVSGEKIEGWFDLKDPTAKKAGKPMKARVCVT